MPDLHIAYDDKDFERLKSKLENNRRIRLPTGMNPLLPSRILVWTGPEHKDQGCSINASIEIDLVPSGACGTPRAGDLNKSLVSLSLKTANGRQMVFKSLNIQYQLATLLSYCKSRELSWDPRKDIVYLCKNETVEVQRIRARLNIKEVEDMFLGTSFFDRLDVQDQRLCYRTLLDTLPPPTMAIAPPAPQPLPLIYPTQRSSEQINDTRVSRSRYWGFSGQRGSSDGTAEDGIARDARPPSMGYLQDPRQLTQIQGLQCVKSAKPQPVSAAAAAKQARKSMPNLMAPHATASYLDIRSTSQQQERQQHHSSHPVEYTSSQLYSKASSGSSQREYGDFQPAHMRATMTGRTDSTKTNSTGTSVQGIQSQTGSLHAGSPEGEAVLRQQYFEERSTPIRERLHLVVPEGVHDAPEHLQRSTQPQSRHYRHSSAPPPQIEPAFVFELDATAPTNHACVAELPASCIEPSPAEQRNTRHEHVERPAAVKPLKPRTTFPPTKAGSLPASLVAGGVTTHGHRQSLSPSAHLDDSTPGFSTRQTNAYRYSSYALPQAMSSRNLQIVSEEATGAVYKAYRPVVATHELIRNDSVSSVYSPGHQRSISHNSAASHESDRLATEYRELLNFEDGYESC
ncbi:uncharacterized protein M421DRAFT_5628 [Didymella exigua CBS 183.55]|uniref:Uncharacterized protein n=1 Tax=Didymella exigua CBS 183.55 TaxID=1150837 RepID=A0A6A5RLV2_9PLEO|nr:uncharacterized protein M421DRAFT_5628 [Didymella exigua CBS 183.55]KAF1927964.1 hypothetical protein M421DRAFT_5628 [Didymella exigua CBS 183.55]